jgi:hypothetical protein
VTISLTFPNRQLLVLQVPVTRHVHDAKETKNPSLTQARFDRAKNNLQIERGAIVLQVLK